MDTMVINQTALHTTNSNEFEHNWQRGLTLNSFKAAMHKRIDQWTEK
jgi:hypothetical protein